VVNFYLFTFVLFRDSNLEMKSSKILIFAFRCLLVAVVIVLETVALMRHMNFNRVYMILPVAVLVGALSTRLWLSIPRARLIHFWAKMVEYWRYPKSLLLSALWSLALALLPHVFVGHFPDPEVHDEFSFCLAADTFAHGRLTNPSPPGWEHFESFHILLTPSYQSKYQPGMGLMLGLGEWLTGKPYAGMILALVFSSIVMTWMLHLWLPRSWAMPMALLAIVLQQMTWGNNYFVSGPLCLAAGAMQLGLLKRFANPDLFQIRFRDGVYWGLSVVIFAWTRPFEGALASLMVGLAILVVFVRGNAWQRLFFPLLPGFCLALLPAIGFQLQYDQAVVGSPWRLPYMEYERQYSHVPIFLFQPMPPSWPLRHDVFNRFNESMADWYQEQHHTSRFLHNMSFRFGIAWLSFGLMLWLAPMLTLPELWARAAWRNLLLYWFGFLGVLQFVTWFLPHYAAPALAAWFLVMMTAIRYLRLWRWRNICVGRWLAVFLIATNGAYLLIEESAALMHREKSWPAWRRELSQDLQTQGGQHLVFVHYPPHHKLGEEWVYNRANLAEQPVIWARSMNLEADRVLQGQYSHCRPWLLEFESTSNGNLPVLRPYPAK
jgi:hypothetical protein